MFLDRISQHGLLVHDPESNIMKLFPLGARRSISGTVASLLQNLTIPISELLSSDAHVKFVLEILGEAFRLPIDSSYIIGMALDHYTHWVTDETTRPAVMSQNFEHYLTIMLQQLTLLFECRGKTKEEVDVQAGLCIRALNVFTSVARMQLKKETWDVILKLLLGSTDSIILLSLNGTTQEERSLSRILAERIMHDLYEVWLLSRCKDDHLWASFKLMNRNWLGVSEVTAQWNATILGLTTHVLNALYLPAEKQSILHINVSQMCATFLDLEAPYSRYVWLRFLHLLGDVNTISQPAVFMQAMLGISACVDEFLKIVTDGCVDGPDGNTIAHLFGRQLFEALFFNRPGFEEGTSVAIKTLCKIFCVCARSVWSSKYLSAFYTAIRCGLVSATESRVLAETLLNAKNLFSIDLPACRVLVPFFVHALERVFNCPGKEAIRPACITILSSLICLANRFQNAAFPQEATPPNDLLPPIRTYYDLEPHIAYLLSLALTTEKVANNTKTLLWQSFVFLLEFLPSIHQSPQSSAVAGGANSAEQSFFQCAPKFAWTFLNTVLNQISSREWTTDVMCVAVDVLASMVSLNDHIDMKERFAQSIVMRLCTLINERGATGVKADEALVAVSFRCITQWIMVNMWATKDKNIVNTVIETCLAVVMHGQPGLANAFSALSGPSQGSSGSSSASGSSASQSGSMQVAGNTAIMGGVVGGASSLASGQTVVNTVGELPKTVVDSAYQCLLTILNEWGVFPSNAGAERMSSVINEEFLLKRVMRATGLSVSATSQYIRYFALDDNRILTVIDVPTLMQTQGFSTILIMRDRAGKHVWRASLKMTPNVPPAYVQPAVSLSTPQCVHPFSSMLLPFSEVPEASLASVYSFLDSLSMGDLEATVNDQLKSERIMLDRSQHGLSNSVAIAAPLRPAYESLLAPSDECKCLGGRVLLNHLGLILPTAKQLLHPLDPTPSFFSGIRQLDQQPERDCMTIGIVLQRSRQELEEEIYANQSAPTEFNEFVDSLGWPVKLATHTGFMGGLSRKGSHGETAPYYADCMTEVMYHVAPMMPQSGTNTHKKRLISKDFVLIAWSEDGNYDDNALDSLDHHLKIIIHPLSCGLYHVRTVRDEKISNSCFGPLQTTMIISKYALGPLVRMTAINAYRAVQAAFDWMFPFAIRHRILTDLVRRNKVVSQPSDFFSNLFLHPQNGKPGAGEALIPASSAAIAPPPVLTAAQLTYSGSESQPIQIAVPQPSAVSSPPSSLGSLGSLKPPSSLPPNCLDLSSPPLELPASVPPPVLPPPTSLPPSAGTFIGPPPDVMSPPAVLPPPVGAYVPAQPKLPQDAIIPPPSLPPQSVPAQVAQQASTQSVGSPPTSGAYRQPGSGPLIGGVRGPAQTQQAGGNRSSRVYSRGIHPPPAGQNSSSTAAPANATGGKGARRWISFDPRKQ